MLFYLFIYIFHQALSRFFLFHLRHGLAIALRLGLYFSISSQYFCIYFAGGIGCSRCVKVFTLINAALTTKQTDQCTSFHLHIRITLTTTIWYDQILYLCVLLLIVFIYSFSSCDQQYTSLLTSIQFIPSARFQYH